MSSKISRLWRWAIAALPLALWPATTAAEFFVLSGETFHGGSLYGPILTPAGDLFDFDAAGLQLIGLVVENEDTLVYDFGTGFFEIRASISPSSVITEGNEFAGFDEGSEICLYTASTLAYACSPSPVEMNAAGALIHLGDVSVGGGVTPPTDSDGDGVPDVSDNCPNISNTNQANNDGDALGDVCDPDDDNDGLLDIDEINVYGTNPFLVDTDGDGFTDSEEIAAGTDPLDAQSFPDPEPPVPALGTMALLVLTTLLMVIGWAFRTTRREAK